MKHWIISYTSIVLFILEILIPSIPKLIICWAYQIWFVLSQHWVVLNLHWFSGLITLQHPWNAIRFLASILLNMLIPKAPGKFKHFFYMNFVKKLKEMLPTSKCIVKSISVEMWPCLRINCKLLVSLSLKY
jgi:hypothetical protein